MDMKIGVVGLGAVGAQVLWSLSKRPEVEAHGFERGYIAHPFAGAGGEGRLFRNLELTTMGYMPIIKRADELWEELEAAGGRRLRRKIGGLLLGSPSDDQLEHAIASAREWKMPHEIYGTEEVRRRFPHFSIADGDVGVWDSGAGVIAPERSIAVAVDQAARAGAIVHEFSAVQNIEERADGATVRLASGETQEFDRVVVACGGWTTKLVPELHDWIVTKRLTSAWFAGKSDESLRGLPPFMHVSPSYCYGIPNEDEQLVKLGLGFNDHLPAGDPDVVPRQLEHHDAKVEMEKFMWILRDLLPHLDPNPVRIETYIESYTRSMHEFLGVVEGRPNTVVLGGFSGHGFKIAPALGEVGAELATSGETGFDLGFLDDAQPVFAITDIEAGTTTHNPVVASGADNGEPVQPNRNLYREGRR